MDNPVLDYQQKPTKRKHRWWLWGIISIIAGFVPGVIDPGKNEPLSIILAVAMFTFWLVGIGLILPSILKAIWRWLGYAIM
jgi:hypothetical protein